MPDAKRSRSIMAALAVHPTQIEQRQRRAPVTKISDMRIERISTAQRLTALRAEWNALARGMPFRTYEWLDGWWRAYGSSAGNKLMTLAVFDHMDKLIGLAPWYVPPPGSRARIVRFLGSGEVCSDYLTVLAAAGREPEVASALARWLNEHGDGAGRQAAVWDALELSGIHHVDQTVMQLVQHLAAQGDLVHRWNRSSCWRVHLPGSW